MNYAFDTDVSFSLATIQNFGRWSISQFNLEKSSNVGQSYCKWEIKELEINSRMTLRNETNWLFIF